MNAGHALIRELMLQHYHILRYNSFLYMDEHHRYLRISSAFLPLFDKYLSIFIKCFVNNIYIIGSKGFKLLILFFLLHHMYITFLHS